MMRNLFLVSFLMISLQLFSQVDLTKKTKMDFYFNSNLNVDYNLGNRIKENQNKDSYDYQQNVAPFLPNDFTYGISAIGGYNFLPNFAISNTGAVFIEISYGITIFSN